MEKFCESTPMNEPQDLPEFGERVPGQRYVPRPGAYAVLLDGQGRIAVMQSPGGCYLPGGGTEGNEMAEETLAREVREECGFVLGTTKQIGEAVEYVYTAGNAAGIRKECVFFQATVASAGGAATEPDHALLWLDPAEAEKRLAHGSQRWVIGVHRKAAEAVHAAL